LSGNSTYLIPALRARSVDPALVLRDEVFVARPLPPAPLDPEPPAAVVLPATRLPGAEPTLGNDPATRLPDVVVAAPGPVTLHPHVLLPGRRWNDFDALDGWSSPDVFHTHPRPRIRCAGTYRSGGAQRRGISCQYELAHFPPPPMAIVSVVRRPEESRC